jgi:hypothetical protein
MASIGKYLELQEFSLEFIQHTRKLFEPIARQKLTDEQCAEIARNMINLEIYLRKLKAKYEKN